jgi:hypothetical protein
MRLPTHLCSKFSLAGVNSTHACIVHKAMVAFSSLWQTLRHVVRYLVCYSVCYFACLQASVSQRSSPRG